MCLVLIGTSKFTRKDLYLTVHLKGVLNNECYLRRRDSFSQYYVDFGISNSLKNNS